MSNQPRSAASAARKKIWKSRSPSSPESFSGSPRVDRVERLVALLEEEGPDGLRRLLAVPGALAAQALD